MSKNLKKTRSVSQLAFDIVYSSAEMEGYSFNGKVIKLNHTNKCLKNITKKTVLSFLELEETKVTFIMKEEGPIMIAYNTVSDESIEIEGLGDHFLALIQTVSMAKKKIKAKENGEDVKLLSNKFIPLRDFFESSLINSTSNKIVQDILLYDSGRDFSANQVDILSV